MTNSRLVSGYVCPRCGGRDCAASPSGLLVLCTRCPWVEAVPLEEVPMRTQCDRCGEIRECTFAGRPADPEAEKAQNGEWLCAPCQPLRLAEMNDAITQFRNLLKGNDHGQSESASEE